jgi:hypothetical protein
MRAICSLGILAGTSYMGEFARTIIGHIAKAVPIMAGIAFWIFMVSSPSEWDRIPLQIEGLIIA